MRIKENKQKKCSKLENKDCEDLGYESSLCKSSLRESIQVHLLTLKIL